MICPGCGAGMETVGLEGTHRGPFDVDLCRACRAFWFDAGEQFRLTPPATLTLLKRLAEGSSGVRHPIGIRLPCPKCASVLGRTFDEVGGNQIQFFRCPERHGVFMPVADFLRSQGLVRGLSAHEMDALRRKLTSVTCSSCGGPVPVEHRTACEYCGAAVAVLDTDHLAAALRQLEADAQAGHRRAGAPPPPPPEQMIAEWRARRKAKAAEEDDDEPWWWRGRRRRGGMELDLVQLCIGAFGSFLDD